GFQPILDRIYEAIRTNAEVAFLRLSKPAGALQPALRILDTSDPPGQLMEYHNARLETAGNNCDGSPACAYWLDFDSIAFTNLFARSAVSSFPQRKFLFTEFANRVFSDDFGSTVRQGYR